jgi:4-diphosphocytidyl-2-C-methyl-D-erythritol kinase
MVGFANCKINLGLSVTEKRSDGFHNIETVFYPVMLNDAIELLKTDGSVTEIEFRGAVIDGAKNDNLCLKAYNILKKDFDIAPVKIILYKNIPVGAGLGGGSSDAAFTLKMINDFFSLSLSDETLEFYASKLGSDCSFFIKNKPAFAKGRGDILSPAKIDLSGYEIVIVKPKISVNTAFAYSIVSPSKKGKQLLEILENTSIDNWKSAVVNDFEFPLIQRFQEISVIKETLYGKNAVFAAMSGSGSAVFGISPKFDNISIKDFPGCFFWKGIL